jgi:dihydrofolate reductase
LSRQAIDIQGVEVYDTIEKILHAVEDEADVMIIGGQTIYEQFLPYADALEMTLIHRVVDGDTFFPTWGTAFEEVAREDKGEYSFVRYEKK